MQTPGIQRKNVLVTGASGAVGSALVHQLVEANTSFNITLFDRKTSSSVRSLRPFEKTCQVVYGDITHRADLEAVCRNQDAVIHLAAVIPPAADEFPDLAHAVNSKGTENLLHALEAGSPHAFFIYASSISVYGDRLENPWIQVSDPLIPSEGDAYAITKIEAEKTIRESALDWTIFRLTAIMGRHKLTELLFHMPLDTPLEIATSGDTARAFVQALYHREELTGRIFNLGGGPACRIRYNAFLKQSFAIAGLGKLDFPPKAFAEKNFHCGYYRDGEVLEEILHFRKENLQDYFESMSRATHPVRRWVTRLFRRRIKRMLLNHSLPYKAYHMQDTRLMHRFFPPQ
jgi:nucleoside-diphosphate-sugar epimerase